MKLLHCTAAHNIRQVQVGTTWNQVRPGIFGKNYGSDAGRNRGSRSYYIMDDILIAGPDAEHHEYRKVIERACNQLQLEAGSPEVFNQATRSPIHRPPPVI